MHYEHIFIAANALHCDQIFPLENIYNYFPLESTLYSFLETIVNKKQQYPILLPSRKKTLLLWSIKKSYVASTNV
jgi:hypothetical protein